MANENRIQRLDFGNKTFLKTFLDLPPQRQKEVRHHLSELILLPLDAAPSKLHLHPLKNKLVSSALNSEKKVKVYTAHVSTDDTLKVSFTIEGEGVAYLRLIGEHDKVDKNP